MKNTSSRREEIITLTNQHGSTSVNELSEKFKISTVSIRNDLKYLDQNGLLIKTHGGAISIKNKLELPLVRKSELKTAEKMAIGKTAATLINDGDTILLDAGSTTFQVAFNLTKQQNISVLTMGLNIAMELCKHKSVETLRMVGGMVRKDALSTQGFDTSVLDNYHFDKLFLGVDGIDLDIGLTTHNENEAILNRKMCQIADTVIAVFDSSKVGKKFISRIAPLNNIDIIITDENIDEKFAQSITEAGVKLIIA